MRPSYNVYLFSAPSPNFKGLSTTIRLISGILWHFDGLSICTKLFWRILNQLLQPFGFAMEFHLPYYALRQSDLPTPDPRGLRRHGKFLTKRVTDGVPEYLYEAQISVLVTGIDEWFWTAYCCAETYFGSEETMQFYHHRKVDAPTGGFKPKLYPIWNPREYFLLVLCRRFRQVRTEWANVVNALEGRLQHHVRVSFDGLTSSDEDLIVIRKRPSLTRLEEESP